MNAPTIRAFRVTPVTLNVEAVEKPLFTRKTVPARIAFWALVVDFFCGVLLRPQSRQFRFALHSLRAHSSTFYRFFRHHAPVMRQLLDVVHHRVELPLRIDLLSPARREAV